MYENVFLPQVLWYATHQVLRIYLDVVEWSKMLALGSVPTMLDVCYHQGQGDHHIGLNVACPALRDELQIVVK